MTPLFFIDIFGHWCFEVPLRKNKSLLILRTRPHVFMVYGLWFMALHSASFVAIAAFSMLYSSSV
jgi:hypothetical protein